MINIVQSKDCHNSIPNSAVQQETFSLHRQSIKIHQKCPICLEKIEILVDQNHLSGIEHFPFPHLFIHGDPLHAIILYIDSNLHVRGYECVESLQFDRTSKTFSQIVRHWSNSI